MPYLRFSRDKRGYENTYVLHAFRTEGKARPRMLYWFRTPPDVKVGRLPLDKEAIRAVEANNPNLTFDWNKMLKVRASLQADQRARAQPRPSRKRRTAGSAEPSQAPGSKRRRAGERPATVPTVAAVTDTPAESSVLEETATVTPAGALNDAAADVDADVAEAAAHLEAVAEGDDAASLSGDREVAEHPVVTLMGGETLARLRARYAETQARIAEKLVDPEARDTMHARAEALNPDLWKSIEEAVKGIEQFEAEVDAIQAQIGRRPPRPRREV